MQRSGNRKPLSTYSLCFKAQLNSCLLQKSFSDNLRPQRRSLWLPVSFLQSETGSPWRPEASGDWQPLETGRPVSSFSIADPVPRTVLPNCPDTAILEGECRMNAVHISRLPVSCWFCNKGKDLLSSNVKGEKKKKSLSFSWWKTKGSLLNYDSASPTCKVLFLCKTGFLIFGKFLRTLHGISSEWLGSVQRLV